MTDTPRLRSAFPQTPRTNRRSNNVSREYYGDSLQRGNKTTVPVNAGIDYAARNSSTPLIPFDIIDAPSQRLYVAAFYVALNAWRLYEYWVSSEEGDATWLFLKWVLIDMICFFGLSVFRIPWLEWTFSSTLALFLLHAVANFFLMFRIPVGFYPTTFFLTMLTWPRFPSVPGFPQW